MKKKEKLPNAAAIIAELKNLYPDAVCALDYKSDPWRLLVQARLSAQCTDKRVNEVSVPLFAAFPTAKAMAEAEQSEIEELIRPCGLFRGKAKSIKEAAAIIVSKYGGRVPDTMEELLALPGVGRKIANLLLGDLYGKGGIVADTHCIRICGRLGFYPEEKKDPLYTEKVMAPIIPIEEQSDLCHRIVQFGRDVCTARAPKCGECTLAPYCARSTKEAKADKAKAKKGGADKNN